MAKEYLWGYINKDGEMVIEPRFHDAWPFHEDRAAVKVDWARGYIDRTGAWIVEPKYQYAGPFRDGKARVMLDDVWEFIDRDGNKVGDADLVRSEPDDIDFGNLIPTAKGKKYGYADKDGKFVIKPAYIQCGAFSEGLARVLVAK